MRFMFKLKKTLSNRQFILKLKFLESSFLILSIEVFVSLIILDNWLPY